MSLDSRQIRIFATILSGMVATLAALWFIVLRTEYVPIYQNIRESDASQIVAELDEAGIEYRLENGGHDILVPESEAADARVAVAGAELPLGGTTGFELFNENELGLTEFAQKINLQRAIQGELARTIMMMDGVEFARVHLALPERTLFRSEQERPTAAVTVEMHPSRRLSAGSVAGIRQLVASSVPGLAVENVVILDDGGDLVSASMLAGRDTKIGAQSEREAIEGLLSLRANAAIKQVLPGQPFEVQVSAFEQVIDELDGPSPSMATDDADVLTGEGRAMGLEKRSLRVLVRTPQELGPEERSIITSALTERIKLSTVRGDVLDFSTGTLATQSAPTAASGDAWQADGPRQSAIKPRTENAELDMIWSPTLFFSSWFLIPLVLLMLVLLAIRPRRQLNKAETEDFAELLRGTSLDLDGK